MTDLLDALLGRSADTFQDLSQRRTELARDLSAASLSTGQFVLVGGQSSKFHFHPSLFMTKPTVLRRLVHLLAARVPGNVDRLASSEPGSLAVVSPLALEIGIPFVSVRNEARPGGSTRSVHGEIHAGERVLLVEDVITSGEKALSSVQVLRSYGAEVVDVLCAIDREAGAGELLAEAGLKIDALFTAAELYAGETRTAV